MNPPLVVMGIPRSGTSAVAGALYHLGVYMGEDFYEDKNWNKKGWFQDNEFGNLHAEMLPRTWSGEWQDEPLPGKEKEYQNLIRKRQTKPLWGVKEYRMPWCFRWFCRYFQKPKVIVTRRPFDKSVKSWSERKSCDYSKAAEFLGKAEFALANSLNLFFGRVLTVYFEEMIEDPAAATIKIAAFAEIEKKEISKEALKFIDPKLRRF